MRAGLDAPTEPFSPEMVDRLRAFLDRQRPIELAVWVRHEQQGVDGPLYDHHIVLGVDDELYGTADLPALEEGIGHECRGIPGWLDLFPLSEVEALREFGEVLWERFGEAGELDALDFRFTHEAIMVTPEERTAFVELLREAAPAVVRVHASRARLWKGERALEDSTSLYVGWDESRRGAGNTLRIVLDAARGAGIDCSGGALGAPVAPPHCATVLYDEESDS
jgi:hypothetical protein